ncbi:MAG: hypothetical protein NTU60_09755 [Candidatus Aminicenantes bacterium]|nr:hypothetical protein [Candidatus Aminicenantes bacterium]
MVNRASGKTWVVHKIGAVIMMITAVGLLVQWGLILAMPDDARLEIIKARSKMDIARHEFSPSERPLTDAELDNRITDQKADLLRDQKDKTQALRVLIQKPLWAILLLIMAFGLLRNRRSPTRVVAIIMSVILMILVIGVFSNISEEIELYKYTASPSAMARLMYFADFGMPILLSLSLILTLITAIKPPTKPEERVGK